MQMLSEFEKFGDDRLGAARREETAGAKGARPAAPDVLGPARPAGAASEGEGGVARHTITLTTAYGNVLAEEDVPDGEFGAALRRIHDEAVPRANSIVVIDGVMHTRSSFLEFVRAFNDWSARQPHAAAAPS